MTEASLPLPGPVPGTGVTYRMYGGLDDIAGMAVALGNLRRRSGIVEPVDHDGMAHRYTHLHNSDPYVDCLLAELGGRIVGYVRTEWQDLVEGGRLYDVLSVVDPVAWDLGVPEGFLSWAEAHQREVARQRPSDRVAELGGFGWDGSGELTAVLERHGYQPVRWEAEMLRPDLEAIADVPLAAGYVLRSPAESELHAVWDMLVTSFAEHWGAPENEGDRYESWAGDPRFRCDLVVVAWRGSEPAACVANLLDAPVEGRIRANVAQVATHPAHRRLGLGRATLTESLRVLRAAGASSAYLSVDTDNHNRALDLYVKCGFERSSRSVTYRRPFVP